MDFVEHDLKGLMETMRKKKQVFSTSEIKCLMIQLLRAISHLHDNWILHRDLKSSNLLLSHNGILKVRKSNLWIISWLSLLTRTSTYHVHNIMKNIDLGRRFWTSSWIWISVTSLHGNRGNFMVSCSRAIARNKRILNSNWCVVLWVHIWRAIVNESIISRRIRSGRA